MEPNRPPMKGRPPGGPDSVGPAHGSDSSSRADEPAPGFGPRTAEEALTLVRQRGGRITSSRRLLLNTIFGGSGHHTAVDLATRVQAIAPDVSRSTIYRQLEELQHLGVVDRTFLGHGPAIYHAYPLAHPHLVCDRCGAVSEPPEASLGGLAHEARVRFAFVVNPRHVVVGGLCSDCQQADVPGTKGSLLGDRH